MMNSTTLTRSAVLSCSLALLICGPIHAADSGMLPVGKRIEMDLANGKYSWRFPAKKGQKFRVRISVPGPVGMRGFIVVPNGAGLGNGGAKDGRPLEVNSQPNPADLPLEFQLHLDSSASLTVLIEHVPPTREELQNSAETLRRELKELERQIAELEKNQP